MSSNSFNIPGSELLRKADGMIPSASKEIFAKPKGGGGGLGRASKPAPTNNQPDEDLVPDAPKPEPPAKPLVILTNPKFLVPEGYFEEKVPFSVDADLPASLKDVKRVIVTAWSLPPHGEKQQAFSKDFYVDEDGLVKGEVELRRPPRQDGKEVESCSYYFTAKHRDSKEVQSAHLKVKIKRVLADDLVIELEDAAGFKKKSYAFKMKSDDGTYELILKSKDIVEVKGVASIKFEKLDMNSRYTLELLDSAGKILEEVFSKKECGSWK